MTTAASPSDSLITRSEAQKQLRVAKNTIFQMIGRGEFPNAFRINDRGDWRIPQSDIDAFRKRSRP